MPALAMPVQACCTALVLALLWRSRMQHPLWSSLHAYLLLSAIILVAWRTIDLIRGQLNLKAYQQPRANWRQLGAVALRVAVWSLMVVAVDLAMPEEYFRRQAESPIKSWIAAGVLVLTALLPRRRRWEPSDVLYAVLFIAMQ